MPQNVEQHVTPEQVLAVLQTCYDPCCKERAVSVVELGIIHDVKVAENRKSPNCGNKQCWSFSYNTITYQPIPWEIFGYQGLSMVAEDPDVFVMDYTDTSYLITPSGILHCRYIVW